MYSSDFYAERAAREKIHEEKEHLATELDFTKKLNRQLQDELESLGRYELKRTPPIYPSGSSLSRSYSLSDKPQLCELNLYKWRRCLAFISFFFLIVS